MNREQLLAVSDEQILDEIKRLQYLFSHNKIIRHGLNCDGEEYVTQSVSEHIYNMMTLAEYFRPLEDPDNQWDWEKIHRMILWHDSPELETGDMNKHQKTPDSEKLEEEAIPIVCDKVPVGIADMFSKIVHEYEERISMESIFVKALDSLEATISTYGEDGRDRYVKSVGATKEVHDYYYKIQSERVKDFSSISRFLQLLFERMYKEKYYKE